jgi:hypothetical protein
MRAMLTPFAVALAMLPQHVWAADDDRSPGGFDFKTSGYANLTAAAVAGESGAPNHSSFDLAPELETEFTPQITLDETKFAVRAVVNASALSAERGGVYQVAIPELSAFAIGSFGRVEVGERAGFPQSLVGFTPSEIAFTAAEFGPDSGRRLDPNGGLPTAFLDPRLGARINALTYLGYAERFYDNPSPKIVYLSPRFENGIYGAVSYTPRSIDASGFQLANRNGPAGSARFGTPANLGTTDNTVQAALVYNDRGEDVDFSTGITYSHASPGGDAPVFIRGRDTNSLAIGSSATINDTWALGLSFTYDGLSAERTDLAPELRSDTPYGVVTSLNYVDGPWIVGGYYQHAAAASSTIEPRRDVVDVFEIGASYQADNEHDLLGPGYYTEIKLFVSAYHYGFGSRGSAGSSSVASDGTVILAGVRFSFF